MTAPKPVFVTGGNGFIGSRVVRLLCERGYAVRCLLRATSRTDRIDDLEFERVGGDILDPGTFEQAMNGCRGVVHLAGSSSWAEIRSGGLLRTAVDGTENILKAAAERGLKTVVVSSNAATGGASDPAMPSEGLAPPSIDARRYTYAFAKQRVEQVASAAASAGAQIVVVRPTEVYGPNDRDMITAGNLVDFARSSPVFVPSGGTGIVHVDDVAEGIVAAFERGKSGECYVLNGENLTIRELATLTLRLLGQRKKVVTLPNSLLLLVARVGSALRFPLPFEPNVIPYAVRYWYADNAKARQELGVTFRPAVDTLRPALEWLVEEGHVKAPPEATLSSGRG